MELEIKNSIILKLNDVLKVVISDGYLDIVYRVPKEGDPSRYHIQTKSIPIRDLR